MSEVRFDQMLNIKTLGKREWELEQTDFHRYEATPYQALRELLKEYPMCESDKVIDYGCGRGRVLFYLNNLANIRGAGIENHQLTFQEALVNKQKYYQKYPERQRIELYNILAEEYKVCDEDNIFYFFNPFSHVIFEKVLHKIESSFNDFPRRIDIVLFYPLEDIIKLIERKTIFKFFKEVKLKNIQDKNDRFIIYRVE